MKNFYQDKTGYIKGYFKEDYFWVSEFVIYPKFRSKNLARKLSTHLPQKCILQPYPLFNSEGAHIPLGNLIAFYTSLGFQKIEDKFGNLLMKRSLS